MSSASNSHTNDCLTLVIRLACELEHTHAPETLEVLTRWKPALDAMLAGKTREEAIAALCPEPQYPCPLKRQELNDALDVAECCVYDQIKDPGEREYTNDGLRKLRTLAMAYLDGASAVSDTLPMLDECGRCGRQIVHKNAAPQDGTAEAPNDHPARTSGRKESVRDTDPAVAAPVCVVGATERRFRAIHGFKDGTDYVALRGKETFLVSKDGSENNSTDAYPKSKVLQFVREGSWKEITAPSAVPAVGDMK